jgi:predicted nicotinamide N-methyase
MFKVLDLPQLYTRPAAEDLLQVLTLLTSTPASFGGGDAEIKSNDASSQLGLSVDGPKTHGKAHMRISTEGLARYLTSIIASDLRWIPDDSAKEIIWEQASLRLSERSGRTAMSAMTRTFHITMPESSFDLVLHEPAMTGDNLGLKTWASSYQLAKRLHLFSLPQLPTESEYNVLELGSGTGLVGLAAAALGWSVCLTDLPDITPNLQHNAEINRKLIESHHGSVCIAVLDWTRPLELSIQSAFQSSEAMVMPKPDAHFPIILVADALYSMENPRLLVQTIETRLAETSNARVIAEMPVRPLFMAELDDFRSRMAGIGLKILDEGNDIGYDDWGWDKESDDVSQVTCWWSIWTRD